MLEIFILGIFGEMNEGNIWSFILISFYVQRLHIDSKRMLIMPNNSRCLFLLLAAF